MQYRCVIYNLQLLWFDNSNKHFCLFRKLSVAHYLLSEPFSGSEHFVSIASFQNAAISKYYRPSLLLALQLAIMVLRAEVSCSKECCPFHRRKTNRGTRKIRF